MKFLLSTKLKIGVRVLRRILLRPCSVLRSSMSLELDFFFIITCCRNFDAM